MPSLVPQPPPQTLIRAPNEPISVPIDWVTSPESIDRERQIIRDKFLTEIVDKRKMAIDLDQPIKIPMFRIRHNEAEIKRRWYKTPQAFEHHNQRVDDLIKAFHAKQPIPPVMARLLGPDRYRIWDGNHRLIAAKRLGVPYVWAFVVKPTKVSQMPERNTVRFRGVLYEQVDEKVLPKGAQLLTIASPRFTED